jgi:hypothetical protein
MEGKIEQAVMKARDAAPVSYFANDEGSLTCYSDEMEFCFCAHCLSGMRAWLQTQYAGLAALNAAWDRYYSNWEEATPDTFDEASARNRYRAWGDHRLYMEQVFAGAYGKMIGMVRRYDPAGVLRMSGCQVSSAYTGCDYYELHKHVGYFEAYAGGNQLEFHRSFRRPGTILGGWTGYGVSGAAARHQIWYRVLHGLTLHSVFWYPSSFNPDLTYPQTTKDLSEPLLELRREGIGKLLLHGAARGALGIALHYSMRSVHGAYAMNREQSFTDNREGWVRVLEDCGYQYDFLATQQIEAGGLDGYTILILPYSTGLSDKEAEAIRAFAERGGTVVGDFQTGVFESGRGTLDDLFGIERRNTYRRRFYTCQEFFPAKGFDLFEVPESLDGFVFAEEGIRAAPGANGAYYQDFAPALPAVVVNRYGSGKGIYLNASLDPYPGLRKSGGGEGMRRLISSILTYAGVVKFCSLSDPVTGKPAEAGYETVYYHAGGARYAAILRDREDTRAAGHDGLTVGSSGDTRETTEALRVTFPEQAHIYDVRKQKYLGFAAAVDTELAAGDALVLAILPEKIERVTIGAPERAVPGEAFDLTLTAFTESGSAPPPSVFAVTFTAPSGRYVWEHCENVACAGAAALSRRLPYNAERGTWTVTVKDAATGLRAAAEIAVG